MTSTSCPRANNGLQSRGIVMLTDKTRENCTLLTEMSRRLLPFRGQYEGEYQGDYFAID